MKYIVYLTTNLKSKINGNNRIYIGVHETENPDIFDGYIGCGIYIQQPSTYKYPKTPFQYAVKKYGTDAFKREVLYIFDTEEEAYKKEEELVDINFLKLEHTYNACLGGKHYYNYKPLYQFDLKGNLKKIWKYSKEAYEFYGYPMEKFEYAIHDKHPFLDSIWSTSENINYREYTTTKHGSPQVVYLYSKNGKYLGEFESEKICAEYLNTTLSSINHSVKSESLISKQYYVSKTLVDVFIPKPRIQYISQKFYVYKNNELIFEGVGKEIMPVINLNSGQKIGEIFRYKDGWYKDFYISIEKVDKIPEKSNNKSIKVDIYDKYGNFIETMNKIKDVREKYKISASKIKNIQCGDKYVGDYIFKYHNPNK